MSDNKGICDIYFCQTKFFILCKTKYSAIWPLLLSELSSSLSVTSWLLLSLLSILKSTMAWSSSIKNFHQECAFPFSWHFFYIFLDGLRKLTMSFWIRTIMFENALDNILINFHFCFRGGRLLSKIIWVVSLYRLLYPEIKTTSKMKTD